MEKKTIGKFIAVLRKANGMTQKELGDKLLVSDKTVSRWERDENTPDISLIPMIADIFGITSDELLRGERNTQANDSMQNEVKNKSKSDKQFRFMLNKKYLHYKNLSLISGGGVALGLIIAAICDICFLKGLLGFFLGVLCIILAIVLQYSFHTNFVMHLDEDEEEERVVEIRKFNTKIKKVEIVIFIISLVMFSFLLPLGLFNMTYTGLDASAWLVYGSAFAAITLIVTYAIYVFKIKKSLLTKEELYFDKKEEVDNEYAKKLFKDVAKFVGILVAVAGIGIAIVGNFGWDWFKTYESFDSYESFEKFMEELALTEEFCDMDRAEIPEEELELFYEYADWDEIYDEEGNLLSKYIWPLSVAEISYSFDESKDGLPVKVLTGEASRQAWSTQNLITGLLGVLIGVEVVTGIGYYMYALCKKREQK